MPVFQMLIDGEADVIDIMPRHTRSNRRSRSKFAGEYARWVWIDDVPSGVRGSDAEPKAWQLPRPKRLGNVVLGSGIVQRWVRLAPRFGH